MPCGYLRAAGTSLCTLVQGHGFSPAGPLALRFAGSYLLSRQAGTDGALQAAS